MKIKYTGPRPHITHHGITFKDGKDDKYVYLTIAIQILQAIDKDFSDQKSYIYDASTKRLDDETMISILLSYENSLEEDVKKERVSYERKLDEEIEVVKMKENLNEDEKKTWINNLEIMREYRIQRAVNKIFYMHTIKEIAKIIRREKIQEIDTPFFEKFWHVLRTVHGELLSGKSPINSELKVEKDADSNMIARLKIAIF
ncbi:MAG TPA: hypothetical protein CFH79_01290 [Sulfurospirillum sp. UBA11407]|nr:MAG TPA: hypothetical protein CFH79_01290 [Sulfurospirillum sp. UBA11407]